jgi:Core-2/I-Branching enzyme
MIAFLVLAHSDPNQLDRLVRRLAPHQVFVHLDRKTIITEAWRSIPATFIEPRIPVYWAGFSMVEAILALIMAALESGQQYSKLVLLSGACYPIKSLNDLDTMFQSDNGHNYIRYVQIEGSGHLPNLLKRRYLRHKILSWKLTSKYGLFNFSERVIRRICERFLRLFPVKWNHNFVPYYGSGWWALSPKCAKHVVDFASSDKKFVQAFKRSFAPDEIFFHTIIGNSPFAKKSSGLQEYVARGVWRTANLHVIDPSLTKWFTLDDLDLLLASDKYFVRKVSSKISIRLIDELDRIYKD